MVYTVGVTTLLFLIHTVKWYTNVANPIFLIIQKSVYVFQY